MAKDKQTIVDEIVAHINKEEGPFSGWYTGITSDIDERLFGYHRVPKENHWFIWREAASNRDARNIESTLINEYGTDGGSGGGDASSVYVYSYKKTGITNE